MENVGPVSTWPFAWTAAKAFVIGGCTTEKNYPHSRILKLVFGTYWFHTSSLWKHIDIFFKHIRFVLKRLLSQVGLGICSLGHLTQHLQENSSHRQLYSFKMRRAVSKILQLLPILQLPAAHLLVPNWFSCICVEKVL